jgi:hypothetical protein
MTLTVQRVRLGHVSDSDGALVFNGDVLVGVASQLSDEHGDRTGRWFLECSFGFDIDIEADFAGLSELCAWIQPRVR